MRFLLIQRESPIWKYGGRATKRLMRKMRQRRPRLLGRGSSWRILGTGGYDTPPRPDEQAIRDQKEPYSNALTLMPSVSNIVPSGN